jgi:hypothetical protein
MAFISAGEHHSMQARERDEVLLQLGILWQSSCSFGGQLRVLSGGMGVKSGSCVFILPGGSIFHGVTLFVIEHSMWYYFT